MLWNSSGKMKRPSAPLSASSFCRAKRLAEWTQLSALDFPKSTFDWRSSYGTL